MAKRAAPEAITTQPKVVQVEHYADGANGGSAVRQEMKGARRQTGVPGRYIFRASLPATRPAADNTARVIPQCARVAVPLEDARILWQR
jgi:starch phosphorylase